MALRPLEKLSIQTLLGIRFWDRLLDATVSDGMLVTAQRLSDDRVRRLGRPVRGRVTPSGVIAFFGLAPEEYVEAEPEAQLWETVPASRLVVVDVTDRLQRYLPLSFVAQIPLRGPFAGRGSWLARPLWPDIPANEEDRGVYLWSAPGRTLPHGRTAIHAQLVLGDSAEPSPAPYALVEVRQASGAPEPFRYHGVTDEEGKLMLPLPYPPVPDPPDSTYPPLAEQTFTLHVTVRCNATLPEALPGSATPNLALILGQAQAKVGTHWNDADPPVLQTSMTHTISLKYGGQPVLRTALGGAAAAETESVLRIVPT